MAKRQTTTPYRIQTYIRKKSHRRALFLFAERNDMSYSEAVYHCVNDFFNRNPALINYIKQGLTDEEIKSKF